MDKPRVVFSVDINEIRTSGLDAYEDNVFEVEVWHGDVSYFNDLISIIAEKLEIEDKSLITDDMITVQETDDTLWLDETSKIDDLIELLSLDDDDILLLQAAQDAEIVGYNAGQSDVTLALRHANDSLIGMYERFSEYAREMAKLQFGEQTLRYFDYEMWENDLQHDVCQGSDSYGQLYIFTA